MRFVSILLDIRWQESYDVCHFHIKLDNFQIQLDTPPGKLDAFEIKLNVFQVKTSFSYIKMKALRDG